MIISLYIVKLLSRAITQKLSCRINTVRNTTLNFEAIKNSRATFKNALNFCRRNALRIKKEILYSKFKQKITKDFRKEVRKIKGNTTVSWCIYGTSILQDTEIF